MAGARELISQFQRRELSQPGSRAAPQAGRSVAERKALRMRSQIAMLCATLLFFVLGNVLGLAVVNAVPGRDRCRWSLATPDSGCSDVHGAAVAALVLGVLGAAALGQLNT